MTVQRPAPLAREVARRPVLGSVLVAGRPLVRWRVLVQLLLVPRRLLMLLSTLRQVLVAPGGVLPRGQEARQWPRMIAGVPVY